MTATAPPAELTQVSAVIVLHNSADVIAECLSALPPEVEAILVDNASSDSGAAVAARVRPDATIVRPGRNLGFGGGCQAGSQEATRPLLLFLNPDAQVGAAAISALVRTLLAHPRALVGPRLLDASGAPRPVRGQLDIRKDALWLLPASERWIPAHWKHGPAAGTEAEHEVLYVEGACFLVRRSDLVEAGGFDPDLFLYFEESSLAHRLARLGGSAWYEPRAVAVHAGQASTGRLEGFANFHFYRSRVILERKTRGDLSGRMRSAALVAAALVAALCSVPQQLLGRRPRAARDALTALRGTIAGIRASIGPGY